jgi:two-component system NtrC family sensor kinase
VNKPRILVVDDEPALLRACERALRIRGFESVACDGPLEALRVAQEQHFDAVVSDVMMPGMNGLQLRRAIIQKVPRLDGKFIFVTGGYTSNLAEELKTLPHLQKPYSPKDLFDLLEKLTK